MILQGFGPSLPRPRIPVLTGWTHQEQKNGRKHAEEASRVRAPRSTSAYDVETGGAIEMRELPFVMGVLGRLHRESPGAAWIVLKDRKFVDISPDNFDKVLSSMKPHLAVHGGEQLSEDGGKIAVDLDFRSMDDFSPENVAQQVEPLKKLLELRTQLSDLRGGPCRGTTAGGDPTVHPGGPGEAGTSSRANWAWTGRGATMADAKEQAAAGERRKPRS